MSSYSIRSQMEGKVPYLFNRWFRKGHWKYYICKMVPAFTVVVAIYSNSSELYFKGDTQFKNSLAETEGVGSLLNITYIEGSVTFTTNFASSIYPCVLKLA